MRALKIMLFLSSMLIGLSIVAPRAVRADNIIYGANAYGRTDIIAIDPIAETDQVVGSIAFGTQAIARDPETGYVYYFEWLSSADQFAYWDPVTKQNHIVKTYDSPPGGYAKGMDFAPDGTLYVIGNADGFASIDKLTGEIVNLGKITGLVQGSVGRTGDIAFAPDGTLYLATYQHLYTVDLNTLQATLLYSNMVSGPQAITVWSGLAYCGGMLYASLIEADTPDDPNMHSTMYSIDPATGVVTELFPTAVYLNDLTSCINVSQNQAPVFDPIDAQTVTEGQLLEFAVTASDPDSGDTLSFSASNLPADADFDPQTHTFSWTPGHNDIGNHTVTFTVTDDGSPPRSANMDVGIAVNPAGGATTLELSGASVSEDTTIASGSYALLNYGGSTSMFAAGRGPSGAVTRALIRWDLSAIPPGSHIVSAQMSLYSNYSYGGSITINAQRLLKSWVEGTLNGQQRQQDNPDSACWTEYGYGLAWDTAGAGGAGDRDAAIISSAGGSGVGWYTWDVKDAVQKWVDGEWDNDGLLLKAQNESSTNLKYFVPSENQQEDLKPKLIVEYEQGAAQNQAPVFDPIDAQTVGEGQLLEFAVTASDPDSGDTLSFSASNLPAGAGFDPQTHAFSWTPGDGDAGDYTVTFTVTDDGSPPRSASMDVDITVSSSSTTTLQLSGASVTEDTTIASGSYALLNYGGSTSMFGAGKGSSGAIARALIRWDLSAIPPGSRIVSAQMSLYSNYSYGGSITINAHRLLKSWVEGTLNGQQHQLDNPDSACWIDYGYGVPWYAPGANSTADRDAAVISSAGGSGVGWYTWDVKDAVQKWVDGEWDNDGLLLKAQNESSTSLRYFVPSENPNQTLKPALVIEYGQP